MGSKWGGSVINDFLNLGKGDEGDTKLLLFFFTFDLFTFSINIR